MSSQLFSIEFIFISAYSIFLFFFKNLKIRKKEWKFIHITELDRFRTYLNAVTFMILGISFLIFNDILYYQKTAITLAFIWTALSFYEGVTSKSS